MTVEATEAEQAAQEKKEADEAAAEAAANKELEEFDRERAMRTIHAQRESEDKLKARIAEYEAAEQVLEDAKKSREELLDAREAQILAKEEATALREAEVEFKAQAEDAGVADPELALLVAKDSGILGAYNPKTGTVEVGKVDFDSLLDDHPVLAGGRKSHDTGDAGRLGGHKTGKSKNDQFNAAIRGR